LQWDSDSGTQPSAGAAANAAEFWVVKQITVSVDGSDVIDARVQVKFGNVPFWSSKLDRGLVDHVVPQQFLFPDGIAHPSLTKNQALSVTFDQALSGGTAYITVGYY
jgi:hypothetical protein